MRQFGKRENTVKPRSGLEVERALRIQLKALTMPRWVRILSQDYIDRLGSNTLSQFSMQNVGHWLQYVFEGSWRLEVMLEAALRGPDGNL